MLHAKQAKPWNSSSDYSKLRSAAESRRQWCIGAQAPQQDNHVDTVRFWAPKQNNNADTTVQAPKQDNQDETRAQGTNVGRSFHGDFWVENVVMAGAQDHITNF